MNAINGAEQVGRIAARAPWSVDVFKRYDIDFCCGGSRTLEEACSEHGVDVADVVSEIDALRGGDRDGSETWVDRPLRELIQHIVSVYHAGLVQGLPRIAGLAEQVVAVHGVHDLERLTALKGAIEELAAELAAHMLKEERVLFPWILQGNGRTAGEPIRVMNAEHEAAAEALARIRALTDGFALPDYACPTMEALWAALEKLDADLRAHIHLENNILFPRALAE